MTATARKDAWASGDAYEPYVGRWSRLVAREFLDWLDRPAGLQWLEIGCGTGALTGTILAQAAPRSVTAVDPSEAYVEYARRRIGDGRVDFRIGEVQSVREAGRFDVVVSGLVLNFIPDQASAVAAMKRAARPGGVIAAYVWDYAGEMQLMRHFWNAAVALDPAAAQLDEGKRFPICRAEKLSDLFAGAGLGDVAVRAIDVPTVFRDFDDYWSPFLGGQGPAPGYCMSLPEDRRTALRDRIRVGLPIRPDGSIPLVARAWTVRGVADG